MDENQCDHRTKQKKEKKKIRKLQILALDRKAQKRWIREEEPQKV